MGGKRQKQISSIVHLHYWDEILFNEIEGSLLGQRLLNAGSAWPGFAPWPAASQSPPLSFFSELNAPVQNELQYIKSSDTFAILLKLYQFCCNWCPYNLHYDLCLCSCSVHVVMNDDDVMVCSQGKWQFDNSIWHEWKLGCKFVEWGSWAEWTF